MPTTIIDYEKYSIISMECHILQLLENVIFISFMCFPFVCGVITSPQLGYTLMGVVPSWNVVVSLSPFYVFVFSKVLSWLVCITI